MADRIKLIISLLLVGGGIAGFYVYSDLPALYRVLGLLVVFGAAIAVVMTTSLGKNAWGYLQGARTEIRKVVWPTRKETTQTTLLIMVSVIIVGIMLWGLDSLLLWAVQLLTGQRS